MALGPLITDFEGAELSALDREVLSHPLVGGVILFSRNYENVEQIRRITKEIHALRNPKLLISVDHEGGRVQRFRDGFTELPAARMVGELYDKDPESGLYFAQKCGWLMATELRSVGVDFSFAPVLDVRNPRSQIIDDRAFHEDPHRVARIGRAFMRGMRQAGMAAVGKHFPGHGTVVADSHLELPIDQRSYYDLANKDLIPFRLLASEIDAMMPAHIVYPKVDNAPAGYSSIWIKKILRDELEFQGIVFSDDLNMSGAAEAGGVLERAQLALQAGCDLILLCNNRTATETLLSRLTWDVEPVTQVRLMRMHGKGRIIDFEELQNNDMWIAANESVIQVSQERTLDLGDDMLT